MPVGALLERSPANDVNKIRACDLPGTERSQVVGVLLAVYPVNMVIPAKADQCRQRNF